MQPIDKASALIEALPYLQAFRGKGFPNNLPNNFLGKVCRMITVTDDYP